MEALVQSLALGEQKRPFTLLLHLKAIGLLQGVRQAIAPNSARYPLVRSGQQRSTAATVPAAAAVVRRVDMEPATPTGAVAAAARVPMGEVSSGRPRVSAGVVRQAMFLHPAWSVERIELRDANEVFNQHQRPLGKLHGHEVAVGIAHGGTGELVGAAVASKPRLAWLDDALTAELRGIAVANDVPGGTTLLLAAISRAALESGFRRLVWRKKVEVVPFELVRAGWDRMPDGCLPEALGNGFTVWAKVLRGHEWLG
jgi:hypothetical protein